MFNSSLKALFHQVANTVVSGCHDRDTESENTKGEWIAFPSDNWVNGMALVHSSKQVGEDVEASMPDGDCPINFQQLDVGEVKVDRSENDRQDMEVDVQCNFSDQEPANTDISFMLGFGKMLFDVMHSFGGIGTLFFIREASTANALKGWEEHGEEDGPESNGNSDVDAVSSLKPCESSYLPVFWVSRCLEGQTLSNECN